MVACAAEAAVNARDTTPLAMAINCRHAYAKWTGPVDVGDVSRSVCSRPRHPSRRHNGLASRQEFDTCLSLGWICRELSLALHGDNEHDTTDLTSVKPKEIICRQGICPGGISHHTSMDRLPSPLFQNERQRTAPTSTVVLPDVHTVPTWRPSGVHGLVHAHYRGDNLREDMGLLLWLRFAHVHA